MKILIADDEALEHEGLSRMITGMPLQVSDILHAWNGREALDIIHRENPEILITDVRMPVMNGLELLKMLSDGKRECEVLFISGYEDFHAVREAMLLGANNWIVKPVNRDELYSMLCRMNVQKQHRERSWHMDDEMTLLRKKLLPFEQEELIRRFLLNPSGEREKCADVGAARRLNLLSPDGQYVVMAADLTEIDKFYLSDTRLPELAIPVTGPVYMPGGSMALVMFFPALLDMHEIQSKAEEFSDRWKLYLEERCAAPVTVGVSMVGGSGLLHVLYRQTLEALREQEVYGKGKVFFFYEDNPTMHVTPAGMNLDDWMLLLKRERFTDLMVYIEQSMTLAERGKNLHDSRQFFIKLIHATAVQAGLFPLWGVLAADAFGDIDAIYNAETLPELLETLRQIFERWRQAFHSKRRNRNQEIVRDALSVIERDLAGDLYSEAIAGQIFITASHLRRTFKNVMGMTLQDYVLRVRMEKAQELLRSTRLRILDIAQMTGYSNIPYFTMAFKAYTRMTPGDYRSRMRHEDRGLQ